MFPSVARAPWHHYNSRAEKGPVWTDSHMSATNRRLADGRGVFLVPEASDEWWQNSSWRNWL